MDQGKVDALQERLKSRTWRLSHLYWIVNEQGQKVLFKPNAVQVALLRGLWFLSIILKSRQHGVTTFFCILFLDACLFNSNVRAGIIAHNREDAESFFRDKVKFAYDNLPVDLRAIRPARSDSARELSFSNNSAIRVGTSMRSATLQYLHISEFGKICAKFPERAIEIITGSLNTVHVGQHITIESTAEGNHGHFYDFCQIAKKLMAQGVKLTPMDFKFFFFAWWQDPKNRLPIYDVVLPSAMVTYFESLEAKHGIKLDGPQKAWYSKKWVTQGDLMKREHPSTPEEAFEAAIEGAYFATQFQKVYREGRIRSVPYDSDYPVDTWWDLGVGDDTSIWFKQTIAKQIRFIDYYANSGEGLDHYAGILEDRGYNYGTHVAPHDIEVRELGARGAKTRKQTAYDEYGLKFVTAPRLPKDDQIAAARGTLAVSWFDEEKTPEGVKGLENYRKEWDPTRATWRNTPYDNWAAHPADAFETGSVVEGIQTTLFPNLRRQVAGG